MTDTGLPFNHFINRELDRHPPETQRECCDVAARAAVACNGTEYYADLDMGGLAEALARGLFGPAYEEADRTQKLIWCEMYEDALCEAIEEAA